MEPTDERPTRPWHVPALVPAFVPPAGDTPVRRYQLQRAFGPQRRIA
jgi:hypothetical protein